VPWRLVEARSVIELAAARLAAERLHARGHHRLEEALQEIRRAFEADSLDGVVAADGAFHVTIVQASHNDVFWSRCCAPSSRAGETAH